MVFINVDSNRFRDFDISVFGKEYIAAHGEDYNK